MKKLLNRYLNVDFISYFSFVKVYFKKYKWFLSLNIEILKPWEFIFLKQNFKIFSVDNEGALRVFKVCVWSVCVCVCSACVRVRVCACMCVRAFVLASVSSKSLWTFEWFHCYAKSAKTFLKPEKLL